MMNNQQLCFILSVILIVYICSILNKKEHFNQVTNEEKKEYKKQLDGRNTLNIKSVMKMKN